MLVVKLILFWWEILRAEPAPLLVRRGGCASKKKLRSLRSGADGVVTYGNSFRK